jgi:hypothetical protein
MKIDWNNISEDRILIDMDLNEWNFVRSAIREKSNRLLSNFDTCLEYRIEELKENPTLKDIDPAIVEIFNKEYAESKNKAPYGYKADGTPKQRPGRKA